MLIDGWFQGESLHTKGWVEGVVKQTSKISRSDFVFFFTYGQ